MVVFGGGVGDGINAAGIGAYWAIGLFSGGELSAL